MHKNAKEHSVDYFKLVAAMGSVMALMLGGMKACGAPWDPPIAEAKKELTGNANVAHEKMRDDSRKDHTEIKQEFKEHEGEIKEDIKDMKRQINSMYRWEREERRNGR